MLSSFLVFDVMCNGVYPLMFVELGFAPARSNNLKPQVNQSIIIPKLNPGIIS